MFWFFSNARNWEKTPIFDQKEISFLFQLKNIGEKFVDSHVFGKFVKTCDELFKRFKQAYFTTYPGYYFTGDGAYRDKDGYYQITGRMDDVINVTGHRLGTAEVEDVLVSK